MRSEGWLALLGVALLALVGCGSKADTEATASATATDPATAPAATAEVQGNQAAAVSSPKPREIVISPQIQEKVARLTTPDATVGEFLAAMRDGDEQTIAALLSEQARQATNQHEQLAIQPPGSPDASYRVGTVELVGEDQSGAHVVSVWTEPDGTGAGIEYEVVWVLRRETAGWRIAGMATMIEEDQPPLFLNFEDPDGMLAMLSAAQQQREGSAEAVQAQAPAATDAPVQR